MVLDSNVISCFLLIVDVEIYWHERESLIITRIHTEGFGIGGRAKYEVSTDCLKFPLHINGDFWIFCTNEKKIIGS